ncbi:MAG TPA: ATP-binding protein [Actinomycetota bacterium]|nr:ATP-binding protein [Actinomycetota bacterium]
MPDLQARLVIPPVSTGIGQARRFTREHLSAWGQDGLTETAILMISELVTNAILHGGEGAVLTLNLGPSRLRAEVRDSSPAMPVVRGYSETATTGRGMVIVDALAAAWGTFEVDGGKVVWFEMMALPRVTDGHFELERDSGGDGSPPTALSYGRTPGTAPADGESTQWPASFRMPATSNR